MGETGDTARRQSADQRRLGDEAYPDRRAGAREVRARLSRAGRAVEAHEVLRGQAQPPS